MANKIIEEAVRAAFAANPDNPALARLSATQAVLESGLTRGTPSGLATRANNFHGIKGTGPAGSVNMFTREAGWSENANFKKFNTPEEGFRGHREFLERNPRYRDVLRARSFEEAAASVKAAGYATDPNYTGKLQSIYNKYIQPTIDANPEIASGLMEWQKPLKSSPDHVVRELEALGTDQARKHLQELKSLSVVTKDYDLALNRAVSYVSAESKEVLKKAGVEISPLTLSLAEVVGGQTAVKILQIPDKSAVKMGQLVKDGVISKAMLDTYAKALKDEEKSGAGLSKAEIDNPEEMTVEHFVGTISVAEQQRKRAIADKYRGSFSAGNQGFFDQMMSGNLGFGDLLGMLILALIGDALGLDLSQFMGGMVPAPQTSGSNRASGVGRAGSTPRPRYNRLENDDGNMPAVTGTTNNPNQPYWASLDKNGNLIAGNMINAKADPMSITKAATLLTIADMVKKGEISKDFFDKYDGKINSVMQRSDNYLANEIGIAAAGSKEAFLARMNAMAKERGFTNTNFASIEGLNTGGAHQSTALDMAKLMHALNKDHAEIVGRFMELRPGHTGQRYNGLYGTIAGKTGTGYGDFGRDGASKSFGGIQGNGSTYAVLEAKVGDEIMHYVGVAAKSGMNEAAGKAYVSQPPAPSPTPVSVAPTPAPEKRAEIPSDVKQLVADAGIAAAVASMKPVAATPAGNDTIASAQAKLRATGAINAEAATPVAPAAIVSQNTAAKPSIAQARA